MSLRKAVVCVFTVLVLGSLATACNDTSGIGGGCIINDDCDSGLFCDVDGICRQTLANVICNIDDDCGTGEICSNATCVPSVCGVSGTDCNQDTDCCNGTCSLGTCL